jgi:hypothetical protein
MGLHAWLLELISPTFQLAGRLRDRERCRPLLRPGQTSGGISRSWPNSFTRGRQVCNANLAR